MTTESNPPKLTFKNIGTAQVTRSGKSIRLDLLDCPRSLYDCKITPYISLKDIEDLAHGRKRTIGIYILIPIEEG